jgi:beta-lactamase class A
MISEQLAAICAAFREDSNGRIGLSAVSLHTDERWDIHGEETFPTASVIKLPVLIALMAQVEVGEYSLHDPLMLRRADKVGGSGVLKKMTPGLTMPICDWAFLMMNISDNTATNVLIEHVGLERVRSWLRENDYHDVQLHNKIDVPALAEDLYHFGTATPQGFTRMLHALFQGQLVSVAASEQMLAWMDGVGQDRVGRYLPFTPFSSAPLPANRLRLAGKTGSFKGCRAQTAVIWRECDQGRRGFVLTVMTAGDPAPETWSPDARGVLVIGRIAAMLHDHLLAE